MNKLIPNEKDLGLSSFIKYRHDPDDQFSLSNNKVGSILEDSYGILWVGTLGGGLGRVTINNDDISSLKFFHYKTNPNDPTSISSDQITSIYEDNNGIFGYAHR